MPIQFDMNKSFLKVAIACSLSCSLVWAQTSNESSSTPPPDFSNTEKLVRFDPYAPKRNLDKPRNYFFSPLASFFIPGLDQFIEGQVLPGSVYLGSWLAGIKLAASAQSANDPSFALGSNLFMNSAGFSVYHSFQTAVRTRNDFTFLRRDKTPSQWQILGAPFQFKYLAQPEVSVPLGLLAFALVVWDPNKFGTRYKAPSVRGLTTSFLDAHSAGTWEELVFRGWLMPVLRQWTGSDRWANSLQGAAFGLAHYNYPTFPFLQSFFGILMGHMTLENEWDLRPAIFTHFWWDFLIFVAVSSTAPESEPTLWLPPINLVF